MMLNDFIINPHISNWFVGIFFNRIKAGNGLLSIYNRNNYYLTAYKIN